MTKGLKQLWKTLYLPLPDTSRQRHFSTDTGSNTNILDRIAERAKRIDASGIRRIWQMVATMTDPVDFSIGEPDFHTPASIKNAAIEAISNNFNTYTVTAGIEPLRQAIGQLIRDEFGWPAPQTLVTSGLSGALTLALMATVNPRDHVLIPDPAFVSYQHLVNMVEGHCHFIDTYPDFELTPEKLAGAITEQSKVLILNSPANPTGNVMSPEQLRAIADIARQHDLLIISDEIYREFSYDAPAESIAAYYDKTLVMRGFSKTNGIPGWRLGYVAASESLTELLDRMTTLQQYTFVCAPHPFQHAAIAALACDMTDQIDQYRQKRDLLYDGLKDAFNLIRPQGAFYAFLPAPQGRAAQFVEQAIKNNVLTIPGAVFSQRDTHFRISYATTNEQIKKGIQRLRKLAKT